MFFWINLYQNILNNALIFNKNLKNLRARGIRPHTAFAPAAGRPHPLVVYSIIFESLL